MDHSHSQTTGKSSEQPAGQQRETHILLLSKKWGWSEDGGLSLFTKEMAKQLAKNEEVQVSCLVLETNEDQQVQAKKDGVDLVQPRHVAGYPPIFGLGHPPDSIGYVDVVIGYGKDVGPHAQPIKFWYKNKWVHIASSSKYELELCEESDLTVAVGSNVVEECTRGLTFVKKEVHGFIPGIFSDFQTCEQRVDQLETFWVIMFYPSAKERAEDKEIPAKTVRMLPAGKYKLIVVCAPGDESEEIKKILLQHHIVPREQLIIRSHCQDLESCRRMFVEVDLLILPFLPSKSERFGLIALQAFSAGLPVLVSSSSGLGNALKELPHGDLFVVDSDEPEEWKKCIIRVKEKARRLRLEEAREMRESYNETYPWEVQCQTVLEKILQQGLLCFHFLTYTAVCQYMFFADSQRSLGRLNACSIAL